MADVGEYYGELIVCHPRVLSAAVGRAPDLMGLASS